MRCILHTLALGAQGFELLLQLAQLAHALGHVTDVRIQQRIHLHAVVFRRILKRQQRADLLQRHV